MVSAIKTADTTPIDDIKTSSIEAVCDISPVANIANRHKEIRKLAKGK